MPKGRSKSTGTGENTEARAKKSYLWCLQVYRKVLDSLFWSYLCWISFSLIRLHIWLAVAKPKSFLMDSKLSILKRILMLIRKPMHFLFIIELFYKSTDAHVFRGWTYTIFYSEGLLKIYNMKRKKNFLASCYVLKTLFYI